MLQPPGFDRKRSLLERNVQSEENVKVDERLESSTIHTHITIYFTKTNNQANGTLTFEDNYLQ